MSSKHGDWVVEQQRVEKVMEEIYKKEEKLLSKTSELKDSVIDLRKTFWDDVTVNLDEPDDVIETEASIKQQAELLAQKEKIHGSMAKELQTLKQLKNSPYFGRIDFKEDDEKTAEQLYIGISSLMDREEKDFLIYDWRAPISSLYYDYTLGKAAYQTLDGLVIGNISLKRQFIIRNGEIKGMFDTGLTIGDQLLQEALGNNASSTMKSIVATIQKEQNKIIRNEKSKLLLVQGVAGSGKTSAALQRIAYLMYRYRSELTPENVVLFSPNPLFTSYINNVLPELGETNVKQLTFFDYLQDKVGEAMSIESPFAQMEYLLTYQEDANRHFRLNNIKYKSTIAYKHLLDAYIADLHAEGVQFKNISFRKRILIPKEKVKEYFYTMDPNISLPNRIELTVKWLLKELYQFQREELNKDWVEEKIGLLDKAAYVKAYYEAQEQDGDSAVDEELILRKVVVAKMFDSLKRQIKQLAFVNVLATYKRFYTCWESDELPEDWTSFSSQTASNLSKNFLNWEDAAPYAYFKSQLLGDETDRAVRHLFVDEAQDLSEFQFAYIKHMFPYTSMTLLGDINQAINVHTSRDNPLQAMGEDNTERITLTKSYRSTKQIVEFTTCFAPGKEVIEPFERQGNKPKLLYLNKTEKEVLLTSVNELLKIGYETIAFICKTKNECEAIYNLLSPSISVTRVDEETYSFKKGILIIPVYLAKGIEFDAVIIPDASTNHYTESDRTVFYTACTRAMHELVMVTAAEPCLFIHEAKTDTYVVANG